MMETNSAARFEASGNVSILNVESIFDIVETDFSEWEFYDDSLYESALQFTTLSAARPARRQEDVNNGWAA